MSTFVLFLKETGKSDWINWLKLKRQMPESIRNHTSLHDHHIHMAWWTGKAVANPTTPSLAQKDWLKILTWKACHPQPEQLSNRREWTKQKNEWNQTKSSLQKIYYFIASSMLLSSAPLASSLHGAQSVGGLCWLFFLLLCNIHLQVWKTNKWLKTCALQDSILHVLHVTTEQGLCFCMC